MQELLRTKAEEAEHKLVLNPTNYNAMADLAVVDTALYTRSTFTGEGSAADDKEKALSLTQMPSLIRRHPFDARSWPCCLRGWGTRRRHSLSTISF